MYDKKGFFFFLSVLCGIHNPVRRKRRKKNIENCRSENVSFPVLWFFQWENFFLILWCEKLFSFFFRFHFKFDPTFFSSSMVCEWVLLNFFPRVVHCFMSYAHSKGGYFVRDRGSVEERMRRDDGLNGGTEKK